MNDLVAIEIMQYASVDDTPMILFQPTLDCGDPHWSFYGWLHIVEWLQGSRKVISFQGDSTTWELHMPKIRFKSIPTPFHLEFHMRFGFFYVLYMCHCWLCVDVAFANVLYERGQFCGRNLYFFSPVVGLVWIGRPLHLLPGLTAMTMLRSAIIQLVLVDGFTRLLAVKR
ncbi:Aste57867_87 [Aphanomyces stellatus]|uniref:Aste57867_87 protein n=1 Tax=Aphanomyces stellatus TaxID=120398 RepID=A0A485K1Q5_9STRA|nr:hypothetical protein As57867_000087 [Aphanomyces stellatus]VFT77313.1 Aste57867_87 [Aphanomyces stellatus]